MRFPSRMVLAGSVLGVFAASTTAALTMSEPAADDTVAVPVFDSAAVPPPPAQAAAPAAPTPPPVTGAQIVALALAPARERATALIAERAQADAERARSEADAAKRIRRDQLEQLRDEILDACDDGRLRGPICPD